MEVKREDAKKETDVEWYPVVVLPAAYAPNSGACTYTRERDRYDWKPTKEPGESSRAAVATAIVNKSLSDGAYQHEYDVVFGPTDAEAFMAARYHKGVAQLEDNSGLRVHNTPNTKFPDVYFGSNKDFEFSIAPHVSGENRTAVLYNAIDNVPQPSALSYSSKQTCLPDYVGDYARSFVTNDNSICAFRTSKGYRVHIMGAVYPPEQDLFQRSDAIPSPSEYSKTRTSGLRCIVRPSNVQLFRPPRKGVQPNAKTVLVGATSPMSIARKSQCVDEDYARVVLHAPPSRFLSFLVTKDKDWSKAFEYKNARRPATFLESTSSSISGAIKGEGLYSLASADPWGNLAVGTLTRMVMDFVEGNARPATLAATQTAILATGLYTNQPAVSIPAAESILSTWLPRIPRWRKVSKESLGLWPVPMQFPFDFAITRSPVALVYASDDSDTFMRANVFIRPPMTNRSTVDLCCWTAQMAIQSPKAIDNLASKIETAFAEETSSITAGRVADILFEIVSPLFVLVMQYPVNFVYSPEPAIQPTIQPSTSLSVPPSVSPESISTQSVSSGTQQSQLTPGIQRFPSLTRLSRLPLEEEEY
jgi:hypothetical protein